MSAAICNSTVAIAKVPGPKLKVFSEIVLHATGDMYSLPEPSESCLFSPLVSFARNSGIPGSAEPVEAICHAMNASSLNYETTDENNTPYYLPTTPLIRARDLEDMSPAEASSPYACAIFICDNNKDDNGSDYSSPPSSAPSTPRSLLLVFDGNEPSNIALELEPLWS